MHRQFILDWLAAARRIEGSNGKFASRQRTKFITVKR